MTQGILSQYLFDAFQKGGILTTFAIRTREDDGEDSLTLNVEFQDAGDTIQTQILKGEEVLWGIKLGLSEEVNLTEDVSAEFADGISRMIAGALQEYQW